MQSAEEGRGGVGGATLRRTENRCLRRPPPRRTGSHVGVLGWTGRRVFSVCLGFWGGAVPIELLKVLGRGGIVGEKRRQEKGLRAHGRSLGHTQNKQCRHGSWVQD